MTQQPHDAYADLAPSVGDRLRIARERRAKLSQGDFADLVNASRGTVSNYERDNLPRLVVRVVIRRDAPAGHRQTAFKTRSPSLAASSPLASGTR